MLIHVCSGLESSSPSNIACAARWLFYSRREQGQGQAFAAKGHDMKTSRYVSLETASTGNCKTNPNSTSALACNHASICLQRVRGCESATLLCSFLNQDQVGGRIAAHQRKMLSIR
jgi:hypothetical protein